MIIAGHGVIISGAYAELMEFAEKTHIPVITTLLGISGFPGTHPLYMGMPGMHGMYWNNMAIRLLATITHSRVYPIRAPQRYW